MRELHGNEVIKPLYDALGEQIHHNKNKADSYRDAIVKALEEVNLPAELVDVAFTDQYDEQMRASLDLALETVGGTDVGVPLISINGTAFFGRSSPRAPPVKRLVSSLTAPWRWLPTPASLSSSAPVTW